MMTPTILKQQVEDLRNSITTKNEPIIEESWSDSTIVDQVKLFSNLKIHSIDDLINEFEKILVHEQSELPLEESVETIKGRLYDLLGWDTEPMIEFWKNCSIVPFDVKTHPSDIFDWDKGHRGMNEIFGKEFSKKQSIIMPAASLLRELPKTLAARRKAYAEVAKVYTSPFATLDELEETLTVKEAEKQVKAFWRDKTKPIEERIKAFNKYGEHKSFIYYPEHPVLCRVFRALTEQMENKFETQNCLDLVEQYLDELFWERVYIKRSRYGRYEMIYSRRNYKPSEKAINRLRNYYRELVFAEGVASFVFDW